MTQPAKVQEPSMEEILASIRRIIADDEANPAAAEKAAASPPAPPPKPEKPAARAPAPPPPAKAAPAPPPKPAAPPPQASNNQDDIDALLAVEPAPPPKPAPPPPQASNNQDDIDALLNGLDEVTTAEEVRPASSDDDVLELTDEMALPEPEAAFDEVEPSDDDLEFAEAAPAKAPPPMRTFEPSPQVESPAPQPMLSRSTVSAVESAFNSLAHTVLSNNARTLEDLVKEMLRPMLKSWLDDNLPALVERIVKAEIERVSRGR
ncbi:MAG TPA: DUF2497 domain-containing protein [Bradyrhizobium sp.]|nr:DUF2497 domain-containing protein [Bradyrhizobium sp.]